ncbi:MAG: hypothetical protein WB696_11015 [Chthoniobacterales bacterium]
MDPLSCSRFSTRTLLNAVRTHPAFSKSRINVGSFLACGYLLGQDPGFFEAEISLPITHRLTYNNMIKEIDLKNASGFSDARTGSGQRRLLRERLAR